MYDEVVKNFKTVDTSKLLMKIYIYIYNLKIKKTEDKIPDITNVATTASIILKLLSLKVKNLEFLVLLLFQLLLFLKKRDIRY